MDQWAAVAVVDEDIARCDKPRAVGETHLVHRGARLFKLTRRENDAVDGGDEPDGVAEGGGVHIVLQKALREDERPDGDVFKAARQRPR